MKSFVPVLKGYSRWKILATHVSRLIISPALGLVLSRRRCENILRTFPDRQLPRCLLPLQTRTQSLLHPIRPALLARALDPDPVHIHTLVPLRGAAAAVALTVAPHPYHLVEGVIREAIPPLDHDPLFLEAVSVRFRTVVRGHPLIETDPFRVHRPYELATDLTIRGALFAGVPTSDVVHLLDPLHHRAERKTDIVGESEAIPGHYPARSLHPLGGNVNVRHKADAIRQLQCHLPLVRGP